jgi:formate-dependent nitrite reductase membrane component NrfD
MTETPTEHAPDDKPIVGVDAHDTIAPRGGSGGKWDGPTYYGRPQLKSAPFNSWVVGGYIFVAAISGSAMLISGIAEALRGRRASGMARHGRYLSLLAPTIGAALLVYDLHTPKRFYNMLRIAKKTSPMSIGTWILSAFTAAAFTSAGAQFAADRAGRASWLRSSFLRRSRLQWIARVAHLPAAIAGAGLCSYTAPLLASTSTPLWAAAPRMLSMRFAASSVAAGASALRLFERSPANRASLDQIALAALAAEFAASAISHQIYRDRGVEEALDGGWGWVETLGVNAAGVMLPAAAHAAGLAFGRRSPRRSGDIAAGAILLGSFLLRVAIMSAGDRSADDPSISFRFSQPRNL